MGGRRRKSGKWDYQGGWKLKVKGMGSLWEAGEESGKWDYQGGGNLEVKGTGSLWEAGEERVGSGITKMPGTWKLRGWNVYERSEKRVWEEGLPRWLEP